LVVAAFGFVVTTGGTVLGAGALVAGAPPSIELSPVRLGAWLIRLLPVNPMTTPAMATAARVGTEEWRTGLTGAGLTEGVADSTDGQTGEGVDVMPARSVGETC
jgi:hypothetical protein